MANSTLQKAGSVTVKPSGCKPGSYSAVFVGAFKLPPKKDGPDYGPALLVKFKADDGQEPSSIVSEVPTMRNACGRILAGMLGRPLQPEEQIRWDDFEGQKFLVVVVSNKTQTGTVIGDVARL